VAFRLLEDRKSAATPPHLIAKTLTPVENLLRATAEKEYPWFATNTPLLHAMTGHEVPGWILPFRFLPKTKAKTTTKTV
jgi:hypothetical protein